MDKYPFEHKEHKVYKHTFLNETQVAMIFDEITDEMLSDEGVAMKFETYFKRFFRSDDKASDFKTREVISKVDKEKSLRFDITKNYIFLSVSHDKYVNFIESVMPFVVGMKAFVFGVLGYSNVKNLLVRKTNIFPFNIQDAEMTPHVGAMVKRAMLSPELLTQNVTNSAEGIAGAFGTVDAREMTINDRFSLLLRSGLATPKGNDKRYSLILDSAIQFSEAVPVEEGGIDRRLVEMNDILFDAYHWSVNRKVIALMEKADEITVEETTI